MEISEIEKLIKKAYNYGYDAGASEEDYFDKDGYRHLSDAKYQRVFDNEIKPMIADLETKK